jgi:SAM-dependent methyltransferase
MKQEYLIEKNIYKFALVLKKLLPLGFYIILKKIYFYINFIKDYNKFKKLNDKFSEPMYLSWHDRSPQLLDKTKVTQFDAHYVYHPAWAARILSEIKPTKHIDIASTLSFSTIVSAFINVDFYDYRPALINLSNFYSKKGDLLNLPFKTNSIESISCMHVIEHIGLGRYGDDIDPNGDRKAINELKRVLAVNGNLLFVVPIGKQRIVFNAHRVYTASQILDYFKDFKLMDFSLLPDDYENRGMIKFPDISFADSQFYACGCFWFRK